MNEVIGRWRILGSDGWDRDALDLVGKAHIELEAGGMGSLLVIAVEADIDWRVDPDGGACRFSWDGFDELDRACGRGVLNLIDDHAATGVLFFHRGDEIRFDAQRA